MKTYEEAVHDLARTWQKKTTQEMPFTIQSGTKIIWSERAEGSLYFYEHYKNELGTRVNVRTVYEATVDSLIQFLITLIFNELQRFYCMEFEKSEGRYVLQIGERK